MTDQYSGGTCQLKTDLEPSSGFQTSVGIYDYLSNQIARGYGTVGSPGIITLYTFPSLVIPVGTVYYDGTALPIVSYYQYTLTCIPPP